MVSGDQQLSGALPEVFGKWLPHMAMRCGRGVRFLEWR
jgi:hypothetical protein